MFISRKSFLLYLSSIALYPFLKSLEALEMVTLDQNFKYIYGNPKLQASFLHFLENVFHIYPPKNFHQLIKQHSKQHLDDEHIYKAIQKDLPGIKPFLSELRYALPALKKQRKEMLAQSTSLLGELKSFSGYLEVGTPGRYI